MTRNIIIKRVINRPVESNSYIVYNNNNNNCIVIDPGTEDCEELLKYFSLKHLIPSLIILTHEHFDHIWGINKLKDTYDCKILSSKFCSDKISDKKKNMSVFYDQVGFESYPADILIEDINYQIRWNRNKINFIMTSGHTNASICILVNNNLFTGDTIIQNTKTLTKFPSGSKASLVESLTFLNSKFLNRNILIFPGHGDSFLFDDLEIQELY
jgi:hydroxyacylglutathione hydrolase